jgi:hypothetical protein
MSVSALGRGTIESKSNTGAKQEENNKTDMVAGRGTYASQP